jgi:hypothetical protein
MDVQGLPGGGIFAISSTAVGLDLSALQGYVVAISCPADFLMSFSADASTDTTLVVTATAASTTTLVADPVAGGYKIFRQVQVKASRLVARTVVGASLLTIKPVRKA